MTHCADAIEREFRIWVDGRLSDHFADGLAGVDQRNGAAGTVLRGDHVDDAHLLGVLDQLRGLGIGVRRFEVTAKAVDEGSQEEGMTATTHVEELQHYGKPVSEFPKGPQCDGAAVSAYDETQRVRRPTN